MSNRRILTGTEDVPFLGLAPGKTVAFVSAVHAAHTYPSLVCPLRMMFGLQVLSLATDSCLVRSKT